MLWPCHEHVISSYLWWGTWWMPSWLDPGLRFQCPLGLAHARISIWQLIGQWIGPHDTCHSWGGKFMNIRHTYGRFILVSHHNKHQDYISIVMSIRHTYWRLNLVSHNEYKGWCGTIIMYKSCILMGDSIAPRMSNITVLAQGHHQRPSEYTRTCVRNTRMVTYYIVLHCTTEQVSVGPNFCFLCG